ncbi:hypothetical protein PILCRDRAFT_824867 [Piloderma croceum F 1598]|uniref:Uncharacterized protein n=1 Tax=Piloderma croceum (strain F 1598) TaxID=765440 RepID=A0A0C3BKM6_PILCF|nr:hypothetical protein PILCRDRAFT_824867 [Piloderma croceum F 1598]
MMDTAKNAFINAFKEALVGHAPRIPSPSQILSTTRTTCSSHKPPCLLPSSVPLWLAHAPTKTITSQSSISRASIYAHLDIVA